MILTGTDARAVRPYKGLFVSISYSRQAPFSYLCGDLLDYERSVPLPMARARRRSALPTPWHRAQDCDADGAAPASSAALLCAASRGGDHRPSPEDLLLRAVPLHQRQPAMRHMLRSTTGSERRLRRRAGEGCPNHRADAPLQRTVPCLGRDHLSDRRHHTKRSRDRVALRACSGGAYP